MQNQLEKKNNEGVIKELTKRIERIGKGSRLTLSEVNGFTEA